MCFSLRTSSTRSRSCCDGRTVIVLLQRDSSWFFQTQYQPVSPAIIILWWTPESRSPVAFWPMLKWPERLLLAEQWPDAYKPVWLMTFDTPCLYLHSIVSVSESGMGWIIVYFISICVLKKIKISAFFVWLNLKWNIYVLSYSWNETCWIT